MARRLTPKAQRVTRLARTRTESGYYTDGQHIVQDALATECRVHRNVVSRALSALACEGHVTEQRNGLRCRYLANATHVSRQPGRILATERDLKWMLSRMHYRMKSYDYNEPRP